MVNFTKVAILASSAFSAVDALPKPSSAPGVDPDIIPGKYIVTLQKGLDVSTVKQHMTFAQGVHARSNSGHRGIGKQWNLDQWNGYSGYFDDLTAEEIRRQKNVQNVEPDRQRRLHDVRTQDPAEWGLASLSHKSANTTGYVYDDRAGEGGYAYIIDTGILDTHQEFEGGRAVKGYNAVDGVSFEDRKGHGTHVAGTICGRTYGVAKRATCVSVKVFDEGGSDTETVLEGLNWAVNNITAEGRQAQSVINMSIGGAASQAENRAVEAAFARGVTVVVSAGNDGKDARSYSPASSPNAITVGAIGSDDSRAEFSNYGDVIDVYAPGVKIKSAYIGGDDATETLDGTSMAAPHVSGLVLYLKSLFGAQLDAPQAVVDKLKALALSGSVHDARGSDSRVYNGNGK